MRKEAENFLSQAESDLRNAKLLFENEAYDLVAFLSHQIAEKAIKAYLIKKKNELPPKTHNLKELADAAGVPIKISLYLRDLTPHYIVSRYPDASNGIPAELYTKQTARDLLEKATEVLKWVKEML
jgi:HEPN domain-containing protein